MNLPRAWKSLWAHTLVRLGNVCQVEVCFSLFGDSVVSMQDRCTVCSECMIGLEIILAYLMVVLGDMGQVKAHFGLFGDSVNALDGCTVCIECTMGMEIILDTPDGSPG
jgi:hypothetical protein